MKHNKKEIAAEIMEGKIKVPMDDASKEHFLNGDWEYFEQFRRKGDKMKKLIEAIKDNGYNDYTIYLSYCEGGWELNIYNDNIHGLPNIESIYGDTLESVIAKAYKKLEVKNE